MNNSYSSPTSEEQDEYPKITQADLDRAQFRVGLKPVKRKQSVTLMLDTNLVEYFKAQAGEGGYQTLINETLRQAIKNDAHMGGALKLHDPCSEKEGNFSRIPI